MERGLPLRSAAGENAQRLAWPRENRILRRAEYTACYEGGRRFHTEHFIVFVRFGRGESPAPARLGAAVSRKVGKAVLRNRIKRLLREFFRHYVRRIPDGTDIVVVAKKQAGEAALRQADVDRQLGAALRRAERDARHEGRQAPARS